MMRLTKRFFAMNALAVLASIALTALAVVVFVAVYARWIGPPGGDARDLKTIFEARAALAETARFASGLEFEQLLDPRFQDELSARVQSFGADAIIVKEREPLFSTRPLQPIDIEKSLLLSRASDALTIELDDKTYMFERTDFVLPTGEKGALLLFAPVRLETNFYGALGLFTVIVFLLSFLATNFSVSYRFSRRVVAPIARLKDAAARMSAGDLSGGIAEEGEGEARELARALETMRMKLKDSLYLQQKFDENRRFLISSISHDLKTPVTSIIGYIEGVLDGVAETPEKRNAYLSTARAKAFQVNQMIDDLLLYAKLDLKQAPFHLEETDLEAYFTDCVADCAHDFERQNMTIELINQLSRPVKVRLDRERMKRVVQNIVDNARKFADQENGRVEIVLRETKTSAIVEIRDNGPGIPEKDLPYVFDRFYRADGARQGADGSGLGLAIAKQIVEGHDGKIWARSGEGEGTRMMISLRKR